LYQENLMNNIYPPSQDYLQSSSLYPSSELPAKQHSGEKTFYHQEISQNVMASSGITADSYSKEQQNIQYSTSRNNYNQNAPSNNFSMDSILESQSKNMHPYSYQQPQISRPSIPNGRITYRQQLPLNVSSVEAVTIIVLVTRGI